MINMISRKIAFLIGAFCLSATMATATAWQRKETCSNEAKPDKLETFSLIHDTLCQEGSAVVEALMNTEASNLPAKKQKENPVESLWNLHASHIEKHLEVSEKVLFPKLNEFFGYNKQKNAKVVQQSHKRLRDELDDITHTVIILKQEKDESKYAQCWKDLQSKLRQYERTLHDESRIRLDCILPVSKQHIPAKEWGTLMRAYIDAGGVSLGSLIHFMTEKKFRDEYMKARGIPSFVWYAGFKSPFRKYQEQFSEKLVALQQSC